MPWTACFNDGPLEGTRHMDGPHWRHLYFAVNDGQWGLVYVSDSRLPAAIAPTILPAGTVGYIRDEHHSMLEPIDDADGLYQGIAFFNLARRVDELVAAFHVTYGTGKTDKLLTAGFPGGRPIRAR